MLCSGNCPFLELFGSCANCRHNGMNAIAGMVDHWELGTMQEIFLQTHESLHFYMANLLRSGV